MFKEWFKREMKEIDLNPKPVEEAEDISVDIEYNGTHNLHVSEMRMDYDNRYGRYFICYLYLKGEGRVKFELDGIKYNFTISPWVTIGEYKSEQEAYLGACEMDEKHILEELKKEIIRDVASNISTMRAEEARKLISNKKFNFNITIQASKGQLLK